MVTAVCVSVPRHNVTLLHGPGCNLGNGRGCPLVVHYWGICNRCTGFRCYDNIARTRNVSECLYSLYVRLLLHCRMWSVKFFVPNLLPSDALYRPSRRREGNVGSGPGISRGFSGSTRRSRVSKFGPTCNSVLKQISC